MVRAEAATSSREARAPAIGPEARTLSTSPVTAMAVGMAVIATRIAKIRRRKGSGILVKQSMELAGVRQFDTRSPSEEAHAQSYSLPLVQHEAASGNHRYHRYGGDPGSRIGGSGGDGPGLGDAHLGVGLRERP